MGGSELLDIVDDECNIIDIATREDAHNFGLLHGTFIGYGLNIMNNKVYVTKRSYKKEKYKGYFSIAFGGHILSGENHQMTANKETREELGRNYQNKFLTSTRKYDGTDNEIQHIYTVMIDKHPILDSDELIGGRFMCPKTELPDFMNDNPFIPETKNLYNILMKHYFS